MADLTWLITSAGILANNPNRRSCHLIKLKDKSLDSHRLTREPEDKLESRILRHVYASILILAYLFTNIIAENLWHAQLEAVPMIAALLVSSVSFLYYDVLWRKEYLKRMRNKNKELRARYNLTQDDSQKGWVRRETILS